VVEVEGCESFFLVTRDEMDRLCVVKVRKRKSRLGWLSLFESFLSLFCFF
jgi:hypothetical protein